MILDKHEAARAVIEYGKKNPAWWIEKFLGVKLWSKQVEICESIRDRKVTAVKSCHGIGKTFVCSCIVWWYLCNHKDSIVLTTAPSERQVKYLLWVEVAKRYNAARIRLPGRLLTQEIQIGAGHYALGFTARDYDENRFQGFHAQHLLAILDEASGITPAIHLGLQGVTTGPLNRLLEIGNPTDPLSPFAGEFKPLMPTSKFSVAAWDTPNFTEFGIKRHDIIDGSWYTKLGISREVADDPVKFEHAMAEIQWPQPHLVTPDWVARMAVLWGMDSQAFFARVEARFPIDSERALLKLHHLMAAREYDSQPQRHKRWDSILACDVARFGSDSTVIVHRRGQWARIKHVGRKQDTMETVGHLVDLMRSCRATEIRVDDDGLGGGVVDRLNELQREGQIHESVKIIRIRNGARPKDTERYPNIRSECYGEFAQQLEAGEVDLPPDDEELLGELQSIQARWLSNGKMHVEEKKDIKKRLGRSPDKGDAFAYAFWDPPPETNFYLV